MLLDIFVAIAGEYEQTTTTYELNKSTCYLQNRYLVELSFSDPSQTRILWK